MDCPFSFMEMTEPCSGLLPAGLGVERMEPLLESKRAIDACCYFTTIFTVFVVLV